MSDCKKCPHCEREVPFEELHLDEVTRELVCIDCLLTAKVCRGEIPVTKIF